MSIVLNDFSQLKKSVAPAPEPPPPPKVEPKKDDVLPSLLGEMMGMKPAAKSPPPPTRRSDAAVKIAQATSEAETFKTALDEMAGEIVAAEQRLAEAQSETRRLEGELAAQDAARAALAQEAGERQRALQEELERVKAELAQAQSRETSKLAAVEEALKDADARHRQALEEALKDAEARHRLELEEARAHAASVSVLLDRPEGLAEVFAGEVREHVLDALREAFAEADRTNRARRAHILESVLATNVATGELARRREEVKRIVGEGGRVVDDAMISKLARIGFRFSGGNGRNRFDYAGVRIATSVAPGVNHGVLGGSAEINGLVY